MTSGPAGSLPDVLVLGSWPGAGTRLTTSALPSALLTAHWKHWLPVGADDKLTPARTGRVGEICPVAMVILPRAVADAGVNAIKGPQICASPVVWIPNEVNAPDASRRPSAHVTDPTATGGGEFSSHGTGLRGAGHGFSGYPPIYDISILWRPAVSPLRCSE